MSSVEIAEGRSEPSGGSSRTMGTMTKNLLDLKAGVRPDEAFNSIAQRYFGEMAERVEPRFRGSTVPSDGEDVAIELFVELRDLFAQYDDWVTRTAVDREGLLVVVRRLAKCHASKLLARERRQKRGCDQVLRESDLPEGRLQSVTHDAPANRVLMKEEIREIEKAIRERSSTSRNIGLGNQRVGIFHAWRAGRDAEEIARMMKRSVRTAQREIKEILNILFEEFSYIPPSRGRHEDD